MGKKRMKTVFASAVRFMRSSKKTTLLILIVAVAAIVTYTRFYVQNLGTIKTIGVEAYWDRSLKNKTESVNWGTIWAGSSQNVTFYVRSISKIEATLYLNATNWNPAKLSEYMTLSWNYNGTIVHPNEIIQVTLTLSASSSNAFIYYLITSDVKQFSFDIIIAASE